MIMLHDAGLIMLHGTYYLSYTSVNMYFLADWFWKALNL